MLRPKISHLLKEIQSGELEWAYCHETEKAVEWTICGFVDEGIKLLEILWSFGIEHSGNVWLPYEGLQIMCMMVGKQPSQIPFAFKDAEEIEKENWFRCFYRDEEFVREVLASDNQQDREKMFEEMESKIASLDSVGHRRFDDSCAASLFACKCGDFKESGTLHQNLGGRLQKVSSKLLPSLVNAW